MGQLGFFYFGTGKYAPAEQEVKHFPIPLRKSLKVISPRGDFLDIFVKE